MSFSRSGKHLKQLLTNHRNPSPTYQTPNPAFAQRSGRFVDGGVIRQFISDRSAEGTSLFTFLFKNMMAGMTVEASVVLPLFLMFMLNMGSAVEMIRLHGNLQLSMWDVGRKLALYSYGAEAAELVSEEDSGLFGEVAQTIFTETYVKAKITDRVGSDYLDASPMVGGSDGMLMLESEILTDDDCLELYVTYSVEPFGSMLGNVNFRMANKYYAHLWNGYRIPGTEAETKALVAYLAENAEVFHLNRKCTHLLLSIRCIFTEDVAQVKNSYGERYRKCEKCVIPAENVRRPVCYIADDGECYHWELNCSGLKRTVRKVTMEEANKFPPCNRCVDGDELVDVK